MGKILSAGLDASLLFTREMVLRQTGAEIWSAKAEPALALIEGQFFDMILLCHTLPDEDVLRMVKLVALFWPNSRVLLLGERGHLELGGVEVFSHAGPVTLLEKTLKLLAQTRAREGLAEIVPFRSGARLLPAEEARKL